jgi:two-component system response regulator HydG
MEKQPENDDVVPLEALERRAIFRALRETSGDKLAAARLLGIGKTTLYRKLKQYESDVPQA